MSSTELVIAGVTILQDAYGRYNLNALHRGSEEAHNADKKPGVWLKRKSTQALIVELKSRVAFSPLDVVHGGERSGTYAHELLAVSYAGWISPAFQLTVNQAFIDVRLGRVQQIPTIHDHRTKVAIETLVRLDAAEYQIAQLHEEQRKTQAVALLAYQGQQWVTIRQYVAMHDLAHQLPAGRLQERYGVWLRKYCAERGLPVYKATSVDTKWPDENTYPIWTIEHTVQPWLYREHGQSPITNLEIGNDGISYNE